MWWQAESYKTSWEISYYFSGPDMRYNGTFVSVPGKSIESYISAYLVNFTEYEKLKDTIPKNGEFSKIGKMGMSIQVGNFSSGVCIQSYHMPISTSLRLEKLIEGYRYAANRAPQVQEFLATL